MAPPNDLDRARSIARAIQTEDPLVLAARLRSQIARDFFGEAGIPSDLQEGWDVLEQQRKVRAEVGFPLPPGGTFTLGFDSVIAGATEEFHRSLAQALGVDHALLSIKVVRNGKRILPEASLDWERAKIVVPVERGQTYDEAVAARVYALAAPLIMRYEVSLYERLGVYARKRVDVAQTVEIASGEG